jgi:hypothetical protein
MREEDNPPRDIQETKHWVHANLKLSAFSDISIEEMEIYELVHMHWEQFTRDGDTLHLLEAIALCFSEGLVVPPWAQAAFCDRVSKVSNEGCSWEEAFGRARPLGQHKKTFKRRDDFDLYHRIQEILAWRPGDPPLAAWLTERVTTDDAGGLWLNVGGEFGLGHRACKERYYEQKRRREELDNWADKWSQVYARAMKAKCTEDDA